MRNWYERNREKHYTDGQVWKAINTDKDIVAKRKSHLFTKYGLTSDDFIAMCEKQHYCCAICGKQFETLRETHVDHDHTTGQVRELLCGSCNRMLGLAHDNQEVLLSAARYLQKHQKEP